MNAFDLIMFDLDGTLVETAPEIFDAVNDTLRYFALPEVTQQQVNDWIGHGTRELLIQALAFSGKVPGTTVRASDSLALSVSRFDKHYQQRCGTRSQLYPQVRETLTALRGRGVKLAVVTNKEGRYTDTVLNAHGLTPLLDAVVSGDSFPAKKPDPTDCERVRRFIRADLNVPQTTPATSPKTPASAPACPASRWRWTLVPPSWSPATWAAPPKGEFKPEDSLAPVAKRLGELLGRDVPLVANWVDGVTVAPARVVLLENCRVNKSAKRRTTPNWPQAGRLVRHLCARRLWHRPPRRGHHLRHRPVRAHRLRRPAAGGRDGRHQQSPGQPQAPAGRHRGRLQGQHQAHHPASLASNVDQLIVGGGIANTFMLAAGLKIGKSLAEPDLLDQAKAVIEAMKARGAEVPIPTDVVTAKTFAADAPATVKAATDVADDDLILDIGPETAAKRLAAQLKAAGTIVWNGPVGVFEFAAFENGTKVIAQAIAESQRLQHRRWW
jgi:phosphoglycerate kinase